MEDNKKKNEHNLAGLLSQYVSVWIWSIQFAALTGLTYTFIGYNPRENWGGLYGIFLALFFAVGVSVSMMAWWFNYRFLRNYLIPKFFLKKYLSEDDIDYTSFILNRAFYFLMLATLLRLCAVVFEKLLASL